MSPTDFNRSQISNATLISFDTVGLVNGITKDITKVDRGMSFYNHCINRYHQNFNTHKKVGQVGRAMEVEQQPPTSNPAWIHRNPSIYVPSTARQDSTASEVSRAEPQMSAQIFQSRLDYTRLKRHEAEGQCQILYCENWKLRNQVNSAAAWQQDAQKHIWSLQNQLNSELAWKKDMLANLGQLQDTNADLKEQYDDLKRKYNKKVEIYKELDKTYMDLVRPLRVSGDDHSTIHSRLVHIRVSIESLVQKARGEGSANLNKEAAIDHFRESKLLEDFPVKEAILESYHLNLYMESAIMTALIDQLFNRALGCIFHQSKEFEEISEWVQERDSKIAARWRQQLCILIAQDVKAMECQRESEANEAVMILSHLVSRVYPNLDMSVKIRELCYKAFDLSFVMLGMESIIYPVSTPLGTLFDDTTMTTPQKSNPTGTVSLVIFPAFRNTDNTFNIKPKVWCS